MVPTIGRRTARPRSPGRILLVEDEPSLAAFAMRSLNHAGYHVAGPFACEHEALLAAGHDKPDLALLDVCLRDGDGVHLAELLHRHWQVPVLFVSGSPQHAAEGASVAIGLLQKPYTLQSLVDSVRFCEACIRGEAASPPKTLMLFPGARRYRRQR